MRNEAGLVAGLEAGAGVSNRRLASAPPGRPDASEAAVAGLELPAVLGPGGWQLIGVVKDLWVVRPVAAVNPVKRLL